ncbi:hypothetical protein Sps_01440 [Shewanella psychrophila]|uniref:Phage integrase family protein n=1 Tax=Shewanella psychrophila TaxID=225848 RepID=A0A1S6HM49_9GAMM|nr:hypothetical protein [Shewanella psychrophila]AQS36606.1 hypothetical protein Sps_01440 [Shewanella psychrophila]
MNGSSKADHELEFPRPQDEGLYIQQGKIGKKQIKAWSDRLRKVISEAKSLQGNVASIFVINKTGGGKLTGDGFRSSWKRAITKMKEEYPQLATDFTFHDIKAKSLSDFEGTLAEKQQFSGHKNMGQVNTYERKVVLVPSLGSKRK